MLILDATSFPKQGAHSVGVTRQYCGTLGKVANCQVAVTAALWTGARAWMLGAILYLPQTWLTPDARRHAGIPAGVRFQEKWRSALTLLRPVRASGFRITAVLGDAEFGSEPRRGSSTTWWPCQQPHRGRRWSASPIIAGRSSSNTKSSKTNSSSITSRDVVPRLAPPCGLNGACLRVAATRTTATWRMPPDAACRTRGVHRDSDGAFLRNAAALSGNHAETPGDSAQDLTK